MITFIPIAIIHQNIDDPSQALLENSPNVISFTEALRRLLSSNLNDEQIKNELDKLNLQSEYQNIEELNKALNQDSIRSALSKELPFRIYVLKCDTNKNEVQAYRELILPVVENHWNYGERKELEPKPTISSLSARFRSEAQAQSQIHLEERLEEELITDVMQAVEEQAHEDTQLPYLMIFHNGLIQIVPMLSLTTLSEVFAEMFGRRTTEEEQQRQNEVNVAKPKLLDKRKDYEHSIDKALVNYFKFGALEKREVYVKDALIFSFLNKIKKRNEKGSYTVNQDMIELLIKNQEVVEKVLKVFTEEDEFNCPLTYAKPKNPFWIDQKTNVREMQTYDGEALLKAYIDTGKSPMSKLPFGLDKLAWGLNPHQVTLALDDLLAKELETAWKGIVANNNSINNASFTTMFKPSPRTGGQENVDDANVYQRN